MLISCHMPLKKKASLGGLMSRFPRKSWVSNPRRMSCSCGTGTWREAEWFRRSSLCVSEGQQKQKWILPNDKAIGAFSQGYNRQDLFADYTLVSSLVKRMIRRFLSARAAVPFSGPVKTHDSDKQSRKWLKQQKCIWNTSAAYPLNLRGENVSSAACHLFSPGAWTVIESLFLIKAPGSLALTMLGTKPFRDRTVMCLTREEHT